MVSSIGLIAFIWLLGIAGIITMKKIQPESFIGYAIWVVFVCVAFTVFVLWHSTWG